MVGGNDTSSAHVVNTRHAQHSNRPAAQSICLMARLPFPFPVPRLWTCA